jgi:hypothetical protein
LFHRFLSEDTKRLLFETSLAQLLDDFARKEQDKLVGWINTLGYFCFSQKEERFDNFLRRIPAELHYKSYRPGLIWLLPTKVQKALLPAALRGEIDQFRGMDDEALASFIESRAASAAPVALSKAETAAARLSAKFAIKPHADDCQNAPSRPTIDPFLQLLTEYWKRAKNESEFLQSVNELEGGTIARAQASSAALLCLLLLLPSSRCAHMSCIVLIAGSFVS